MSTKNTILNDGLFKDTFEKFLKEFKDKLMKRE